MIYMKMDWDGGGVLWWKKEIAKIFKKLKIVVVDTFFFF